MFKMVTHKVVGNPVDHVTSTRKDAPMRRNISAAVIVAILTMFAFTANASAYCGPGFLSKKQAISFYKSKKGKPYKVSLKKSLVKKKIMHADQDVIAFLENPKVVYSKTPKGYVLNDNTACKGSTYVPYKGRLRHSGMGVLAVRTEKSSKSLGKETTKTTSRVIATQEVKELQADGSYKVYVEKTIEITTHHKQKVKECTADKPFMKAYCRNVATGRSWTTCKTKEKEWDTKETKVERELVREIPPPSTGDDVPPPAKPGACVININGNNNVASCGDIEIKCMINGSNVYDSQLCSSWEYCTTKIKGSWDSSVNQCVTQTPPPTTPPTTPPCPPGTTGMPPNCETPSPAPVVIVPEINDVEVSQTRPFTIEYELPAGHSGTLRIAPKYGQIMGYTSGVATVKVSGSGAVTVTYKAPGEVPAATGGKDTIAVSLRDDTTGKEPTIVVTEPFTIKPRVVHPA